MRSLDEALRDAIAPPPAGTPAPPPDPGSSECAHCRGARFVRMTSDPSSPDFGRVKPCECALAEDVATRTARLRVWAGIGTNAAGPVPDDAPEEVRTWIADPQGWLAIIGPPGSGKTKLCVAAVAAACERGERGLYVPVPGLMEELGAARRHGGRNEPDAARRLRRADVVAFDDADRGTRTAWARERLDTLLEPSWDERALTVLAGERLAMELESRWRAGAPTVIACEGVPRLGSGDHETRLAARVLDPDRTTLVELRAPPTLRYTDLGRMPEERLRSRSFENFDVNQLEASDAQERSLASALRAAQRWARGDHAPALLTLTGGTGTGKTHLACAATVERMDAGQRVVFAKVPVLLDTLRDEDGEGVQQWLLDWVIDADVLVLDDLGAERSTEWNREQLDVIVDARYSGRAPTILTTNRRLADLPERIASRLAHRGVSEVCQLDAPDYRGTRAGPGD